MAFNWGLAFTIGKAAHGVRKAIQGGLKGKQAAGAGLVDPNQSAMVNLMHRQRRAVETGTSDVGARGELAKTTKDIHRRSILGGARGTAHIRKLVSDTERSIVEGRAGERLGLLQNLSEGTKDIADRSMDLVELAKERKILEGQASKQTGSKNVMAQLPAVQDILESNPLKRAPSDTGVAGDSGGQVTEGGGTPKKKGNIGKAVGSVIKGIGGAIGGGKGGGGAEGSSGGGGGGIGQAIGGIVGGLFGK